jgi:hypothetical protein
MSRSFEPETSHMKNSSQHLIAEVPRRRSRVEMTIGIDLGDVWSHYCTLNEDGEVVDRGRFRTTRKAIEKWFTDQPATRVAMEAGTHSIWISEQLQELGHEGSTSSPHLLPRVPVFPPLSERPFTGRSLRSHHNIIGVSALIVCVRCARSFPRKIAPEQRRNEIQRGCS